MGGDELIERGCVSVRDMNARTQKEVKVEDVAEYVQHYFWNEDNEDEGGVAVMCLKR